MGGMHPRVRRREGDDVGVELAVLRTERRTIEYLIDVWRPVEGTALAWSLSWLIERINERIAELVPPAPAAWTPRNSPTVSLTPFTGQWTRPGYHADRMGRLNGVGGTRNGGAAPGTLGAATGERYGRGGENI